MTEKRLVWDLPLRLFHWLLVISIAASWYTAENSEEYLTLGSTLYSYTEVHYWLGYWALGLILFRIVWGFVGPRHARFSSFIAGPSRIGKYLGTFFRRDSAHSVGHNPMGAWSVLLMLAMIGTQATTGLFLVDNTEIYPAPFNPAVSTETAGLLGRIHHLNFEVLQWVICLHVLVILFYLFYKGQNLVRPMLTGRKQAPADAAISSSQLIKAVIVILLVAAAVWLLLQQAPPPPSFEDY